MAEAGTTVLGKLNQKIRRGEGAEVLPGWYWYMSGRGGKVMAKGLSVLLMLRFAGTLVFPVVGQIGAKVGYAADVLVMIQLNVAWLL